jgi:hypothetical protein
MEWMWIEKGEGQEDANGRHEGNLWEGAKGRWVFEADVEC